MRDSWSDIDLHSLFWGQPEWLWGLPWILLWGLLQHRRPLDLSLQRWQLRHPWAAYLHPTAPPAPRQGHRHLWRSSLLSLAVACFCIALAAPQEVIRWTSPPPIGRDIALVVDVSDSMAQADYSAAGSAITRMQLARDILTQFVQNRSGDRFTLMVYGQGAAVLTPPTFDRRHVLYQIQRLDAGLLGNGTALGDALALAVRQVRRRELAASIVLLGDGDRTEPGQIRPREALAAAVLAKIQIHTLQLNATPTPPPPDGPPDAPAADPEPSFADLARLTGGQHRRARNLQDAVAFLDSLQSATPVLQPPPVHHEIRAWFGVPLSLGMVLLVLARVWRPIPNAQPPRPGAAA